MQGNSYFYWLVCCDGCTASCKVNMIFATESVRLMADIIWDEVVTLLIYSMKFFCKFCPSNNPRMKWQGFNSNECSCQRPLLVVLSAEMSRHSLHRQKCTVCAAAKSCWNQPRSFCFLLTMEVITQESLSAILPTLTAVLCWIEFNFLGYTWILWNLVVIIMRIYTSLKVKLCFIRK
jgi:hypothetical protein